MFDGAAPADALGLATQLQEAAPGATGGPADPLPAVPVPARTLLVARDSDNPLPAAVAAAGSEVRSLLSEFLAKPGAQEALGAIFNPAGVAAQSFAESVQVLRQALENGDFHLRAELLPEAQMPGILGAFAAQGPAGEPVVYLNADRLGASPDPAALRAVVIEEVGHALDRFFNGEADSPGDEGQALAGLLLYADANLALTRTVDDHVVLALPTGSVPAEAALSAAISQVHYVPMRESDIQISLKAISTAVSGNIQTVIALTATGNNTQIVYDHWEDGYEADINNPLQASTLVFGDGNLANGAAPGVTSDAGDLLVAGQTVILSNPVNPASPLTPDYDGRDKIGSTQAVTITRAGWSITPGTVLAGAVNLIDSGNAGKIYTLPVGQNVDTVATGTNRLFEYTSAHLIATQNGTVVDVDKDGNGTVDLTFTLNEGETYLLNGGLNAGAKITASKGIGVYLIAGDVGSAYENRWFALTPDEQWSSSYYAPVGTTLTADPSYVILYNPNTAPLTVTYETGAGSGTLTIPATGSRTGYFLMPASAARFYTADGSRFYAVGVIDADATDNATHDWSYSLIPQSYLTDRFVVAWGPGYDKTASPVPSLSTTANGSPVWMTPTADTRIRIDNITDITKFRVLASNGTQVGATPVGGNTYEFAVKRLQSYRIFDDTDKDQTGITVYSMDGTLITAAWGEDPSVAGAGNPFLDMGTTVMPFPDYQLTKSSAETPTTVAPGASDNDTSIEMGEQVTYTVRLTNRAVIDLFDIVLKDAIAPADSATYVPGSTVVTVYSPIGVKSWSISGTTQTFYSADGTVASVLTNTSLAGSSFPLSNAGYRIADIDPSTAVIDGLRRGGVVEVSYRVQIRSSINKALADNNYVITNSVTMNGTGVQKDKINQTQIAVNVTDGQLVLMDSAYLAEASSYNVGDGIGVQLSDGDQNRDPALAETVSVNAINAVTGEIETLSLVETGVNTGIFRNRLPTIAGVTGNNNGVLSVAPGQSLRVEYVDPASGGSSATDPNGIDNPANWGVTPGAYQLGANSNLRTATVAVPVVVVTDGKAEFLDAGLTTASVNFAEGDTLGLRVTDGDQNLSATAVDTLAVVVTNTSTGEQERVLLAETGAGTGVFTGTLATTPDASAAASNSGTLRAAFGNRIQVDYTDPVTGFTFDNPAAPGVASPYATGNANRDSAAVVKIKPMYLSATADLDRIDPVTTGDVSLSQTAAVTPGASSAIAITEDFAAQSYAGGAGWAGASPWVELGDDGSATGGLLQINNNARNGATGFGLQLTGATGSPTVRLQRSFSALTASGTLSFDYKLNGLDTADPGLTVEYTADGTNWLVAGTVKRRGGTTGTDTFAAYPNNSPLGIVAVTAASLPVGTTGIRFSYAASRSNDFIYVDNIAITSTITVAATPASFTQAIPMATDLALPAAGTVRVLTHVSAESGLTSGSYPGITASLAYSPAGGGDVVLATLGAATYAESGTAGVGVLSWSGEVGGADVVIPKGAAVKLLVTNNVAGSTFRIDYDSSAKPSRIELPAVNVIDLVDVDGIDLNLDGDTLDPGEGQNGNGVQEIGFYDQPGGGGMIPGDTISAGGAVYIRVKVKDPFGDYDINALRLSIDGPGTAGDIGVTTPVDATVINAASDGSTYKTFEYAWRTVDITGNYTVTVRATEGYESVSDVAAGNFIVTSRDLGTPSITQFITATGADAGPNYPAGTVTGFLRVTDIDESARASVEVLLNGAAITLNATPTPGVFEATIPGLTNGRVLTAQYTDPNDNNDVTSDVISVLSPTNVAPVLDLDTTAAATVNFSVRFNEGGGEVGLVANPTVGFTVSDDATRIAYVDLRIPSAQILDGLSERLRIAGASAGGDIALDFSHGASVPAVSLGGVQWNVAATVAGGMSALRFTNAGSATLAEAETFIEALRYFNSSRNPTEAVRAFTLQVNDGSVAGALDSNTAVFSVDVTAVADPPAVDLDADDSSGVSGAGYKTLFMAGGIGVAVVDADRQISDPDSIAISSARIVLVNPPDGAAETLGFSGAAPVGITVDAYDPVRGVLRLSGSASLAAYETALSQVRYGNSMASPTLADRRIEISVNDGLVDSNVALSSVRVLDLGVSNATPVNESSPYATFTVVGTAGEALTLALASTATTADRDADIAALPVIEYSNDRLSWTTYSWNGTSGQRPVLPGVSGNAGAVHVRVGLAGEQDLAYEGAETFELVANISTGGGRSASAVTTIVDDGTGSVYPDNGTGNPDVNAVLDDDRPVQVNNVTVNEGSPYALFTVTGAAGQGVTLSLQNDADPVTANALLGTDTAVAGALQYFNGTGWVTYAGGSVTVPAGGRLLVRLGLTNDAVYEGAETFQLRVINAGGTAVYGTATIVDDGTGSVYPDNGTGSVDPGALRDDDRPLTVNSIAVNEASPYAVFQVSGAAGQLVTLSLGNTAVTTDVDATLGTDTGNAGAGVALQYHDGAGWVDYAPGVRVGIRAGSTVLLVRTAIRQDTLSEGGETFTLVALNSGGGQATGLATIRDDGTGEVYPDNGTGNPDVNAVLDDDRPSLLVSSLNINEASPYAVFEVRLSNPSASTIRFSPILSSESASVGVDTGTAMQYYDGSAWVSAASGVPFAAGQVGPIKVRVAIVNDSLFEGEERFRLTAVASGVTSGSGLARLFDDGRGVVLDPDGNSTGAAADDDTPIVPLQPVPVPVPVVRVPAIVPAVIAGPASVSAPVQPVLIAPEPIRMVSSLATANIIPDQFHEAGKEARFAVPEGTFISSNPGERLTLTAELTDGRPLPGWLQFNSTAGSFVGAPPAEFQGALEIRVTARDSQGKETDSIFKLEIGQPEGRQGANLQRDQFPSNLTKPSGRASFNDQLRMMRARAIFDQVTIGGVGARTFLADLKPDGHKQITETDIRSFPRLPASADAPRLAIARR